MYKALIMVVTILVVAPMLIACTSKSATTASCGFVYGNGHDDTKLHKIIYPGQSGNVGEHESVKYVPCNSRNFIINDGTVENANNEVVGDRHTLITASTSDGVPITISARALWTLNQSEASMRDFYNVCLKYKCASDQDIGGNANYSSPGWNGMLGENFGPTMDQAAKAASIKVSNDIWMRQDPAQYKILADGMSAVFADVMRANLGYRNDLFCGSGNSAWSNSEKPGEGEFTCTPVRIVVDEVKRAPIRAEESTQGATSLNTQRLNNAKALYGDNAGYWLALMDLVDRCKAAVTTCIINLGGAPNAPAVPVPVTTPVTQR